MPEKITITEYYSVNCRPYDSGGDGASLLEQAFRDFFSGGAPSGNVRAVENGLATKTHYRLGSKRFRWKKTSGGVTLEEAFRVKSGNYCLVMHDADGKLLSSRTYDSGLHWQSTVYYDGSLTTKPAVVLQRCDEGIRVERSSFEKEELLLPCPWEPGTAEQSFVNEKAGEPLIVAGTDAGSFCFCTAEECSLRAELREKAAAEDGLNLSGQAPDEALDFKVVPNDPSAVKPPVKEHHAAPPAAANLEVKKHKAATCIAPAPRPENGNEYAANHELFDVPMRRPSRYAVAAKGLSGQVRGGPAMETDAPAKAEEAPEPPVVEQEAPHDAMIPARRIVVSSMESYLYFGKLLNGLREGKGRTAAPDGRTAYEGGYRDDMRDGFGVYYYKSGKLCYAGEWKCNLRHGLGVAFGAKDGSIFVGNWKNGSATGSGSEFDLCGCLTYTGGWKDGHRHGYGTEYLNGRILRSGVWENDVFCGEENSGETALRQS